MPSSRVFVCHHRGYSYAIIAGIRMPSSRVFICHHHGYSYAIIAGIRMPSSRVFVCHHHGYSYAIIAGIRWGYKLWQQGSTEHGINSGRDDATSFQSGSNWECFRSVHGHHRELCDYCHKFLVASKTQQVVTRLDRVYWVKRHVLDLDREHRAFIYVNDSKRFDPVDWRDHHPTSKKCVAVGSGLGGCPWNHPSKGAKLYIYLWNGVKGKTVSNVPTRIPDYGMTKVSNFRWGIPPTSNPQKVRKGAFI